MIDLHTHTNNSDGFYNAKDLLLLAKERNVKTIAITDHDTINAYKEDIISYAKQLGVLLIPGIEFSTIDEMSGEKIHVVGLNIDVKNKKLVELCDFIRKKREENLLQIEEKLKEVGIVLRSNQLLASNFVITKSHIAQDILANPANEKIFMKIYDKIPLQGTFIEDYLIKGKPAFVASDKNLNTSYAVEIIKQAGGKAICAHPSFNVMRGFNLSSMKELIIRNKFDGLESINIQYDKSNGDKKVDMVKEFYDFAKAKGLLVSGGSDYHSSDFKLLGNHSELGLSNEDYQITPEQVEMILKA